MNVLLFLVLVVVGAIVMMVIDRIILRVKVVGHPIAQIVHVAVIVFWGAVIGRYVFR
jgi:hypothetical protein